MKERATMMIGIRYCGGCNPRYDRKTFVKMLQERFKGKKEFELAREGAEYEALVVVGGCENCCAAYEHFKTKTKPILVWDTDFFETVEKKIEEIL